MKSKFAQSRFFYTLILFSFFVFLSPSLFAQPATLYSWDFETNGNAEGWNPTHSLSPFVVLNGTLNSRVTGADPYMNGPGGLNINASYYKNIVIRMRVTHDINAEFFWTTSTKPDFIAGLEFGFQLKPDGEFHEYEVPVGNSDKWQGTITRLRLDPGDGSALAVSEQAEVEIDYIRIVHLGPRLELQSFAVDREIIIPGDTVEVSLKVKNTGDEILIGAIADLELDVNLFLIEGSLTSALPNVNSNSDAGITWKIQAADTGEYNINVVLSKDGETILSGDCLFYVVSAMPSFPTDIPNVAQVWSPFDDHWLLENSSVRFAFVKGTKGYGPIIIFSAVDGNWQQMGVIQPPGEFAYLSSSSEIFQPEVYPQFVSTETIGDSVSLTMSTDFTDADGVDWKSEYSFDLKGTETSEVKISYGFSVNNDRQLLHFSGPIIRAGEGSFGSEKQEALFPGLEWLIYDEKSSSSLDVHPPKNKRYIPHPYKVTIPFMSVSNNQKNICLYWDPLQKWTGTHAYPSPLFASPNSWDSQNNHLMGLVVPPVGAGRDENEPLASTPFPVTADSSVIIQATINIFQSNEQLAGMKLWLEDFGIPSLPEQPRSYEEDVVLNCESFMDVLWEPSEKGWHMVLADPWGPMPDHSVANQVWMGALYSDNSATAVQWRNQMKELVHKVLVEQRNPGGLGWDFAFRYGELDQVWGPRKTWAAGHSKGQTEDGGWLYTGDPALQNQGETSLGTCTMKTYVLLQAARITGDKFCLQRGLEALEYMKQFQVPRGAQTWEVPLHAPDILAAAIAVADYVEGYRLTGNAEYLDEAVRWAYAGLPFVYLWSANDRPIMAYGSIPVFGATWYTSIWFGNIVQWNGLDYAYALLKLWQYDQSLPWKQIAEGLTICGMQMQRTNQTANPENKGMYPDAYSAVNGDETYHWDLAPNKIMQNVLALTGCDPGVQTKILPIINGNIHINSGIPFLAELNDTSLLLHPKPVFSDSVFFLIVNVKKPKNLFYDGEELPQVSDVDEVQKGWDYTIDGNIIIKIFVVDSLSEIEIEPIVLLPQLEEPLWEFENDGYSDGWYPNVDIAEMEITDGYLKARSLGADPWFTGPSLEIIATDYDTSVVRMRSNKGSHAQLFWATDNEPFFSQSKSYPFTTIADGNDHVYSLPLVEKDSWKGTINQLRFDPTDQGQAEFTIDYIRLIKGTGAVVPNENPSVATRFELLPNFPNPFNTSTQIKYILPVPSEVVLTIYDTLGRNVRTLIDKTEHTGWHSVCWDGKDENEKQVSSGLYFFRMEAGEFVNVKKGLLLK